MTQDVPPDWFGERGPDAYIDQLVNRAPLVPEVIRARAPRKRAVIAT